MLTPSADFSETILNSVPAHIAVLDERGEIIAINQAWRRFGEENGNPALAGSGVGVNYLHVCDRASGEDGQRAALARAGIEAVLIGSTDHFTLEYPCHAPHKRRWFLLQVTPLLGGTRGAVVVHVDITERKQFEEALRASEERLRLLLESTDEGIYGVDLDGRCTFVNRAAAEMLGFRPEELLERNPHHVFHYRHADGSPYPVEQCPLFNALHEGKGKRVAGEVFWRRDGTAFPVEFASHPILENGVTLGAVVTFTDITERKRVEELREDYLRTIGHDLRGPLTIIHGQAQLLRRAMEKANDNGPQYRTVEAIVRGADRMNAMIQDLVDVTRIESGQLQLNARAIDYRAYLLDLKERFAAVDGGQRVSVELPDSLPKVLADPDRLERILTNLLTNALKYSPADAPVVLRATPGRDEVVTAVVDRGRGIAPEELPHLFERFFRAKMAREGKEGLGLGLYITKGLVEAQGGRIWVESVPGKGSTFYFSLPLAPVPR